MTKIHPTAIIEKGAKVAKDAEIGAFCVIGEAPEDDAEVMPLGMVTESALLTFCQTRFGS